MSLQTIIADIENERQHQEDLWGVENDDNNTLEDWIRHITKYTYKAVCADNAPEVRRCLIQIAALAAAAVESCDRNRGFPEPREIV